MVHIPVCLYFAQERAYVLKEDTAFDRVVVSFPQFWIRKTDSTQACCTIKSSFSTLKGCYYILVLLFLSGVGLSPLGTAATTGLLRQLQMIDDGWMRSSRWNENWQGKPKYSEKTCPSTTLSTTNPIWQDSGSTGAVTVGSQRLTAWDMVRSTRLLTPLLCIFIGPEAKREDDSP
jgi:hypothetical protein